MTTTRRMLNACRTIVVFADDPWPDPTPLPVVSAARNVLSGNSSQSDLDLVEAYLQALREESYESE